jgi:hypothetical protein
MCTYDPEGLIRKLKERQFINNPSLIRTDQTENQSRRDEDVVEMNVDFGCHFQLHNNRTQTVFVVRVSAEADVHFGVIFHVSTDVRRKNCRQNEVVNRNDHSTVDRGETAETAENVEKNAENCHLRRFDPHRNDQPEDDDGIVHVREIYKSKNELEGHVSG